jgi:membrane-associated phospholipid phosphatase
VRYAGESSARGLDHSALVLGREWSPVPRGALRSAIDLADPVPAAVIVVALTGLCLLLRRRRLAILAATGPLLTGVATTVLKPLVGRMKDGDLAYPSGHMGFTTAAGLVVALLVVSLVGPTVLGAVGVLVAETVLVAGGMGLALTITTYHYATDVIGGFCVGAAVILGLALLIDKAADHPLASRVDGKIRRIM